MKDRPLQLIQAALVAKRYYVEQRHKNEIAEELGMSRFKVARLLELALEQGLVRIEITIPAEIDVELSARLETIYALEHAVVLAGPDLPSEGTRRELGKLAASALRELLSPDDVLGIAWGRTLDAMVDALPALPPCSVVQIAGGLPLAELSENSIDLVRRLGEKTGAKTYPLYAPLIVSDVTTATSLRADPSVAQTLEMFEHLTIAVLGIGSWEPPCSLLLRIVSEETRRTLLQAGVRADICACLLDSNGRFVKTPLEDQSIAIGEQALQTVPTVMAVAGGTDKAEAIHAVLQSGIVKTLVTDGGAARLLLHLAADTGDAARGQFGQLRTSMSA